ncbi:hypothetical protein B0H17DRAFT_1232474 [Mycena rosella]|uniref:F-box domain-containing protein n=1 Tax=Mycena rosella TaxID=1033263 RepID=A0AAD7D641_MYCRO|nr:hypothetical protein B0H17DRAFT_1232474 [Mycena rosella]
MMSSHPPGLPNESTAETPTGTVVHEGSENPPFTVLALATEITAEIFAHCLPDLLVASKPRTDTAPLLLGRICSTWRNIALTTPKLWSRLEIAGAAGSVYTAPWLARAGNQPLTLSIALAETTQILAVLKEYAHRWRDVHLDLSFAEFHLFGPELHLPLLQRLLIFPRHNADADAPKHSIDAFRNAPALRELSLSMVSPAGIALPWAQLTTFTGSRMTFIDCLDFLRCMPNLVNCRVDFEAPEDDPVLPVARLLPFPFLTSLYISSWNYAHDDPTDILDHISTPALETFELAASVGHVLYLEVLQRFLTESECPLRELILQVDELNVDYIPVYEIEELLSALPTLERLELRLASPKVLATLGRRLAHDPLFLPRLSRVRTSSHLMGFVNGQVGIPGPPIEQRIHHEFAAMLEATIAALSTRWAAPDSGTTRQILEYSLTYCDLDSSYDFLVLQLDRTVAAFQARLDEMAAQGIKIHVGLAEE